jgi:hypothetical protein
MPITVAARSSLAPTLGSLGSYPTQGMDVCVRLFCVCVVLCVGSGLPTGWSPVRRVLPSVYRIKKLKKRPRSSIRTVEPYIDKYIKYVQLHIWSSLKTSHNAETHKWKVFPGVRWLRTRVIIHIGYFLKGKSVISIFPGYLTPQCHRTS